MILACCFEVGVWAAGRIDSVLAAAGWSFYTDDHAVARVVVLKGEAAYGVNSVGAADLEPAAGKAVGAVRKPDTAFRNDQDLLEKSADVVFVRCLKRRLPTSTDRRQSQ